MSTLSRLAIGLLFAISLFPVAARSADPAEKKPDAVEQKSVAPAEGKEAKDEAASKEEKWMPLFDGKSLGSWTPTDFGGQGSVLVKDGMILIEEGQPMTGITWKGKPLPKVNYEIRLEAQKVQGNDFFCALTFPAKEASCSLVLGGWGGGVIGLSSIDGFDASENETTNYMTFDKGTWYKVRLRVTDDRIQAWVDDDRIVDIETADKILSVRIETEANRPLGFATFYTRAIYRKIELRELTKAELAKPAE